MSAWGGVPDETSPDNPVMHAMSHAKIFDLAPADGRGIPGEPEPREAASDVSRPRKSFNLFGWRRSKLAAVRAELEEAQGHLATLNQEIALHVDAREEMKNAHATKVVQLELQRVELEARAEAQAAQLAQDFAFQIDAQIDAVRREERTAHEAAVWALTTNAAAQLEAARRDATDALAAQAMKLDAKAAADVEAAVRIFQREAADALADTVRQHNVTMATVRGEVQAAEAHRATLERDLPAAVERARREEHAAHAAQVAAIEEQAAAQLDATRRDVDTALAILASELETKAAVHLEETLRAARNEAARAATETAQKHSAALAALRARLEDAEARRAKLEHDLPTRLEAARKEAIAAHASEVKKLRAHAAAQVDAAVREARDEASSEAAELARRHEALLSTLRAERDEVEARRSLLDQEVGVEVARRREVAVAHAAELATVQTKATAQLEAAVQAAQDEAVRILSETTRQHAAALSALQADLDAAAARRVTLEQELPVHVEAARREAAAAHAAEVEALRAQAAAQVEVAMREVRDEAARAAADTTMRHEAALATMRNRIEDVEARRVRLDQDLAIQTVLRREAGVAHSAEVSLLHARAAAQAEAAVNEAREEAAQVAAEVAGRHALAVDALRVELAESQTRCATLESELHVRLQEVRQGADAALAVAVAELRTQAAAQVEAALRSAHVDHDGRDEEGEVSEVLDLVPTHALPAVRKSSTARQMAVVTGAVALAGLTGTLVGWSVALLGVLF